MLSTVLCFSLTLIRERVLRKECARNLRRSNKELLLEGIFTAVKDRLRVRGMFKGCATVPSSSAAKEGYGYPKFSSGGREMEWGSKKVLLEVIY